jgi:antitoxin VapB
MALNIKDEATLQLADKVAALTGESKTRAIREALEERWQRLKHGSGGSAERRRVLEDLLEREIWPQIPEAELGRRLSRAEREAILGYGPEGV